MQGKKFGVEEPVQQAANRKPVERREKQKFGSRCSLSTFSKSKENPSCTPIKQKVIPSTIHQEVMAPTIPTFFVDFKHPENTPNNWIAFEVVGVRQQNFIKNLIVLQKFVFDQNDLTTGGLKVTLQPGGTSVLVEEHSFPTCIVRHHSKTLCWIKRNEPKLGLEEAKHQFKDKLESVVCEFKKDKDRESKKYFLAFPNGITVTSVTGLTSQEPAVDFVNGKIIIKGEPESSFPKTIYTVLTFSFEKDGESYAVQDESSSQASFQSMLGAFAALNADDSDDDDY
jgi:hypothetical protein